MFYYIAALRYVFETFNCIDENEVLKFFALNSKTISVMPPFQRRHSDTEHSSCQVLMLMSWHDKNLSVKIFFSRFLTDQFSLGNSSTFLA